MKILLDTPAAEPALGFGGYADAFVKLIQNSTPRFAIGIFGGWGSGKTTLMEEIRRKLSAAAIVPVEFSAWRYEKEEHLIVPLLDVIRQSLVDWAEKNQPGKEGAIRTASIIGKSLVSLLSGLSLKLGLPGAIDLSFDANKALARAKEFGGEEHEARTPRSFYHASFCALKQAFAEFTENDQRRVVIFIDDLDRCLPEGALQVLESMKLFFDFDGFVFVVGLDKAVVEAAIDARYPQQNRDGGTPSTGFRIRGADYIKKIFQVPFALPPILPVKVDEFVDAVIKNENLDQEQRNSLPDVKRHLRFVATDAGMNPREIKRYINAFWMIRAIQPHLTQIDTILALLTIEFRPDWQLVREGIITHQDNFLQALESKVRHDGNPLSGMDPRFEGIPFGFFEYVSLGNPGNELLQTRPIKDYLYASAGTQADKGSLRSFGTIRAIGTLRSPLNALLFSADLNSAISTLRQSVESAKSGLSELESVNPMLRGSIEADLQRLAAELSGVASMDGEQRQKWVDRRNAWITQTIADLSRGS